MGNVRDSLNVLHLHLVYLLIVMIVHELLNLGQILFFFLLLVVSDLFESILVFVDLFVCFLCTEGKAGLIFNVLFHCKILLIFYGSFTPKKKKIKNPATPWKAIKKKRNKNPPICFSILLLEFTLQN